MKKGIGTRLDGSTLVVRIPMRFQRCDGRKRIAAPDGSDDARSSERVTAGHCGGSAIRLPGFSVRRDRPRAFGRSVLEEEPEHLPRGIGPLRIGVGPGGAAARPGVAGAVDDPLLEDHLPARVSVKRAAVGMPAGYPTV